MAHSVLIVGVGSIGERHLRCFQATGRVEACIVEINAELRGTVAERYRVAAFESLDAALTETRPQVAVIAVPAHLHVAMATTLVERGVPVLIEKPLSTSQAGIAELQQRAAERGVVAGVAYVLRCNPLLASMRERIQACDFGRPVQLVAVTGQHFPTYRPAYREIYYRDRATGGGAIQDALTHIVNAGEWLVGPVRRLTADAAHQVLDGVTVEDTVHLLARHGDVLASYSLNQHQAPNELTITVVCERGTIRWESHRHRLSWLTQPGGEWQVEEIPPLERDTLFVAQANRFLDAVEHGAPPACSLAEGWQTLRVNQAALASADQGGAWQVVDPI